MAGLFDFVPRKHEDGKFTDIAFDSFLRSVWKNLVDRVSANTTSIEALDEDVSALESDVSALANVGDFVGARRSNSTTIGPRAYSVYNFNTLDFDTHGIYGSSAGPLIPAGMEGWWQVSLSCQVYNPFSTFFTPTMLNQFIFGHRVLRGASTFHQQNYYDVRPDWRPGNVDANDVSFSFVSEPFPVLAGDRIQALFRVPNELRVFGGAHFTAYRLGS